MIIMSVTISTYKLCLVRFHLQEGSYLIYIIGDCFRIMMSYIVLCLCLFVFIYVASFSGLSMFDFSFGIL
jgi:hypothetical protein